MFDEAWVKVSGDLEADARYLESLRGLHGGVGMRQRELKRLERLYGEGYRANVERVLKEGWGSPLLASPLPVSGGNAGGREKALGMVGKRSRDEFNNEA
ncbi:hypothetical protein NH8B_1959 [Pseudogulbenkiania sp. NH8B]|uniref:hypothetical protein n=1 Tax=Pseudogulbenkiania sp. (strain NH8B) TaxID=748280 RepID=UPI00022798BE|nr:hypothetical protein [Pseudogulbenkiania sp. NH8B]BAK76774.1 hypothetical protein NH8B_1959 [Pseudogulbenkiania sp. NH8B]